MAHVQKARTEGQRVPSLRDPRAISFMSRNACSGCYDQIGSQNYLVLVLMGYRTTIAQNGVSHTCACAEPSAQGAYSGIWGGVPTSPKRYWGILGIAAVSSYHSEWAPVRVIGFWRYFFLFRRRPQSKPLMRRTAETKKALMIERTKLSFVIRLES